MKNLLVVSMLLLTGSAKAGLYYDNTVSATSDTMKVAGVLYVNDKTAPNTPKITINGTGGVVTATSFVGAVTGNATTATALAADGTDCGAGNYPRGVDASGNAQSCTTAGVGDFVLAAANSGAGSLVLTGSGGIAASSFTAVYGLNASTAVITYIQSSSHTNTGNFFVFGSLGLRAGTAAPATKLHMSSGTLTIDGNTAQSISALGTVSISTNNMPTTTGGGTVGLHLGAGNKFLMTTTANSTMTAMEFFPNGAAAGSSDNPWIRMGNGTGIYTPSMYIGSESNGLLTSINTYYKGGSGVWAPPGTINNTVWATTMKAGNPVDQGSSWNQVDQYHIMRATYTLGAPVMLPYFSIMGGGAGDTPDGPTVRLAAGRTANAAAVAAEIFNVGASSFTVRYDGKVSLGTSVTSGTQLFYCAGGTFTGNICRGAACICTGGTATGLGVYVP